MHDEVLILGGGVAGCAASIALARKGRSVTLIEREPAPRHKVCGEFLSGEALEDLHALGIDVTSLGAVPIDYVRLAAARRAATAPLPFPAKSLTRKALDTALVAAAIDAGVHVERGRSVQSLSRATANLWQAKLDDGTTYEAPTAFLATGKHDLRGHSRPKDPHQWIGFKMYYRLSAAQTADLGEASELTLYSGGYGGIQPVEDGVTNFCCVVQRRYFERAGLRWEGLLAKMKQDCPVTVLADAALLHRVIANLLDNELNHVPASCTVSITLAATEESATLVLEDDGPGFSSEISVHVFKQRVKGKDSQGHGLGLAFVEAVVRAHGGSVTASNRPNGGALLSITWPRQIEEKIDVSHSMTLVNG